MSNFINMFCPKCNAKITGHSQFCHACAFDLSEANSSPTVMQSAPIAQPSQQISDEPSSVFAETVGFDSVQAKKSVTGSSEMFSTELPTSSVLTNEGKWMLGIGVSIVILMIIGFVVSSSNSNKEKVDINVSTPSFSNNRYNTNTSYSSRTSTSNSSSAYTGSSNSYSSPKKGRLVTDLNIRDAPNKDAWSLGIHFMNAQIEVLEETSYELDGAVSKWYKIRVIEYGCSKDSSLGCGKNLPSDANEGWVNAKYVLLN